MMSSSTKSEALASSSRRKAPKVASQNPIFSLKIKAEKSDGKTAEAIVVNDDNRAQKADVKDVKIVEK